MNKRFLTMLGILGLIFSFCLSVEATRQFSSVRYDMTISGPAVPTTVSQTIYIKEKNVRMEMETPGGSSVLIIKEAKEAYMYIPAQNIAMAIPVPAQQPGREIDLSQGPEMKLRGTDVIVGRVCDVYEGVSEGRTIKIWQARDIQFPIKIESNTEKGKIIMHFSNIQIDPALNDSLFALPAGVKVMDMANMGQIIQGRENKGFSYGEE